MAPDPRGSAPMLARLLAVALLAAGCATPAGRPVTTQAAAARPQQDPVLRGTPQETLGLSTEEQVVVAKLGRGADGQVVLLQILSPSLTPEQQEQVRRDFAVGAWKRAAQVAPDEESWTETLQRKK